MPFSFSEASPELREAVQSVENRADECYRLLRLLKRPANEARWALLTAMALQLEAYQQQYGANSPRHKIRLIGLDRCTVGFKFISEKARSESRLVQKYTWHGSLATDANFSRNLTEQYSHFLDVFPMWHKDHERLDLLPDGRVRFYIPRDSPRERQVIAFQQGYRPQGVEIAAQYGGSPAPEPPETMKLLAKLWEQARPGGTAGKFAYEPSIELVESLRPKYDRRLRENFRRSDAFKFGKYSLREFKSFYIALLILCSIHEYICYPFDMPGRPVPVSSLVMVKGRRAWVTKLSDISGLAQDVCEAIVSDLVLDPVAHPTSSMCIHPFVPLDRLTLAVAPQFPLASAVDDNITRSYSYLAPDLFSAQNTEKEETMMELVRGAAPQYDVRSRIELPDKAGEIDLLLADEEKRAVVLGELKWVRKPYRSLERIARDKEIDRGVGQLRLIRDFMRLHPDFLHERGKLPRNLTEYAAIHYLLLAWDHWYWVEPDDGIAIIDFGAFVPALRKSSSLDALVARLLTYNWLPQEGRDFRVSYAPSEANGAVFESCIFSPVA
jgi:hypothetical protein